MKLFHLDKELYAGLSLVADCTDTTLDASEIQKQPPVGCISDISTTFPSTGDRRISEPSTVSHPHNES